ARNEGDDGRPEGVLVRHATLSDTLRPCCPDEVGAEVLDHLRPQHAREAGDAGGGDDEGRYYHVPADVEQLTERGQRIVIVTGHAGDREDELVEAEVLTSETSSHEQEQDDHLCEEEVGDRQTHVGQHAYCLIADRVLPNGRVHPQRYRHQPQQDQGCNG